MPAAHACSLMLRWAIACPARPSTSPVRRQRLVKRKRGTPNPTARRVHPTVVFGQLVLPRRPPLLPPAAAPPDPSDLFRPPQASRRPDRSDLFRLPQISPGRRGLLLIIPVRSLPFYGLKNKSLINNNDESHINFTYTQSINPNLQSSQILGYRSQIWESS